MNLDRFSATPKGESVGERWNRGAKERAKVATASRWKPIVIGLVALIALIAIVAKFVSSGKASPKAAEAPGEIRQVPVDGLSPTGRIPKSEIGNRVPVRFRWQRSDSASYYFIRIFAPDGTPLDSNKVTAPPYEVSESKRDGFLATGAFTWEVSAYTADAKLLGSSGRVTFTVE